MKKLLFILSIALCGIVGLHPFGANAQYTPLLNFNGANGQQPYSGLYSDGTFLYGMTRNGGTNGQGVVFRMKPDGTSDTVLLNFSTGANGYNPDGGLYSDGAFLYGMTTSGGSGTCSPYPCGTIFKIKPDGTGYTKLIDFTGANGATPTGSLISDGTFLYGMTQNGGTNNSGVLFKIQPNGTNYTKLLDFVGANGYNPLSSLFFDGTFLFGMTYQGGANTNASCINGCGVIFKIKPDGTGYVKLLDFAGYPTNGQFPNGALISDGTFLYGTTNSGGQTFNKGVVFKIKPDGTGYSELLNTNVYKPNGTLYFDGTSLFGTSWIGNYGDIFKVNTNGTGYSQLYNFIGYPTDGSSPNGSLISDGASLYGMTANGGTGNIGVVFKYHDTTATGISENNTKTDFTISPNPFSTQTTLQTDNPLHNATLTVDNCFGQTVKQIKNISGQTIIFNRDNLASGLYFVRLTEENKTIAVDKLVITDK